MNFSDIAKPGRCDVCGKKTDVAVFASQFGPKPVGQKQSGFV